MLFRSTAALALMIFTVAPIAPPARDWSAFPAIVQLQNVSQIEALGDLHGDYDKAVNLLAGAGVIRGIPQKPQDVEWAAGKTVLVCTGDMIDKWTQSVEVLRLMRALQTSAHAAGGTVVVTLGNHEAEFLAAGGGNKKAGEFAEELRAQRIDPAQVAAGNDAEGLGAWLRTLPVAAKVDDWFFCHAGNTFGLSVNALETSLESGIDKDGFAAFVLAEPNSILEARMHPVPWWLSSPPATGQKKGATGLERLEANVAALGCKHLVVGHQPGKVQFGGKVERKAGEAFAYGAGGVLFLNDEGMSRGVQDGAGVVLRIEAGEKERVVAVDAGGGKRVVWDGK
jgi:hypothetical protein